MKDRTRTIFKVEGRERFEMSLEAPELPGALIPIWPRMDR